MYLRPIYDTFIFELGPEVYIFGRIIVTVDGNLSIPQKYMLIASGVTVTGDKSTSVLVTSVLVVGSATSGSVIHAFLNQKRQINIIYISSTGSLEGSLERVSSSRIADPGCSGWHCSDGILEL